MDDLIGTIKYFSTNFAPLGWTPCDGRLLPINSSNIALYSLIGTAYGGDGTTTFAMPMIKDPIDSINQAWGFVVGYCICTLGVFAGRDGITPTSTTTTTTTTTTPPATAGTLLKTSDVTFNVDVEKYTGTAIVWYMASWCGPCKFMEADVKKLAANYPKIKVLSLDIDTSPLATGRYGVKSIPTMVRFDAGKATKTILGAITYAQMVSGFSL